MRQLLFKSAWVAPLVMGIAVICAGSTETDNRLPGREVSSMEASTIKGAACGGYTQEDCTVCGSGLKGKSEAGGSRTEQVNGCDATCEVNNASTACAG